MPDREKVIKAFEECLCKGHDFCSKCYQEGPGFGIVCKNNICLEVLDMLKGQEAIEPVCKIFFDIPYYFCGQCNEMLNMYSTKAMFCSKCGHPVKWGAVKE